MSAITSGKSIYCCCYCDELIEGYESFDYGGSKICVHCLQSESDKKQANALWDFARKELTKKVKK